MPANDVPLIFPAAGQSSRLGFPKGLRTYHNRPWLEVQCERFCAAGGDTVVLVLGFSGDQFREALNIPKDKSPAKISMGGCEVHVLNNPLPEFGPFTSLQEACRYILRKDQYSAAFYQPIDTPVPSPVVLEKLRKAHASGVWAAEPRWGRTGGHPVLLSREFMMDLAAVDCHDAKARLDHQMRILRERGAVASVEVDDRRVVMNLNDERAWEFYEQYERRESKALPVSVQPMSLNQ